MIGFRSVYIYKKCLVFIFYFFMKLKEDIQMLVEEGRLNHKLNELDKLERSAINDPKPAWSVKSYYLLLITLNS